MKKKSSIRIDHIMLMVLVFIHASGCKKDDDNGGGITILNDTVKDVDGNKYHVVTIGTQVWMVENLKTSRYRNGEPILNVTESAAWGVMPTGACCNYDNDANNVPLYGRLYNWYAVNDSRNIVPKGWHIPSRDEWKTLTDFLGGEPVAGGKLKQVSAVWQSPNTGATNETSFTGLPGGYRFNDGSFCNMGYMGVWWSSTEISSSTAYALFLYHDFEELHGEPDSKNLGFSVRCVRDSI